MNIPLTIEWEDIGKAAGNFFLKLLEQSFKLLALLAGCIALGTPGLFSDKLGAAFSGLSQTLRQAAALPGELLEMGRVIRDYNMQSASDFTAAYGSGTIGNLLFELNYAVEYAGSVYGNITGSFFATTGAAFLAFMAFYILSTVLRFARQKGQGSYLVQLERKLGNYIFFKKPGTLPGSPTVSSPASNHVSSSASAKSEHRFPSTTKPYIKSRPASSSSSTVKPGSNTKSGSTGQTPIPGVSPGTKSRPASKTGRGKRMSRGEEDFATDSQTLALLIESARTTDD